jgi:adenylate cyclase
MSARAAGGSSEREECLVRLDEIQRCFEGVVPAVIATAAADGTPNVTYLSRARMVDGERVALSNQFLSKTARNLAENPRASLLILDPMDYQQFRMTLVYERTERRGPVFERLREDVDMIAALTRMQDVFKLRSADIYRVVEIEQVEWELPAEPAPAEFGPRDALPAELSASRLAELAARLARCPDLDTLVSAALAGMDDMLGYGHSMLLLLDEEGRRLYTIGSHGYATTGIGSEVVVGDGAVGLAADRCTPVRLGGIRQMQKYARSVRSSFETQGYEGGREIPGPALPGVESQLAVPLLALGQLVAVLMVESVRSVAFTALDEAHLTVVAAIIANAIDADRPAAEIVDPDASRPRIARPIGAVSAAPGGPGASIAPDAPATQVKVYAVDGSTFVDGEYLIKGVAGRILWSVLGHHVRDGRVEFTIKEVRLDLAAELPAFRDNLDSRLLLLTRRLAERDGTIHLAKTGRGRFRLDLDTPIRLEVVDSA